MTTTSPAEFIITADDRFVARISDCGGIVTDEVPGDLMFATWDEAASAVARLEAVHPTVTFEAHDAREWLLSRVSAEFCASLRPWIGPAAFADMQDRAARGETVDPEDYCDPLDLIRRALTAVLGTEPPMDDPEMPEVIASVLTRSRAAIYDDAMAGRGERWMVIDLPQVSGFVLEG